MSTPPEPWQVAGLLRLSETHPCEVEAALNALWSSRPDLLEAVTFAGIDAGTIDMGQGMKRLRLHERQLGEKLGQYRRRALKRRCIVIGEGGVAMVADGEMPIWEIVRVSRKLGSFERLREAFPRLAPETIAAALSYADSNVDEIGDQISAYERALQERRSGR